MNLFHRVNTKKPLRWSMVTMLLFGWLVPLLLMIFIMIFMVSGRINNQVRHTITTSSDKAVEICTLRIEDCVTASKNASYLPTIRESYHDYVKEGNKQNLYTEITLFLSQQYKYNMNFCSAVLYFTEKPDDLYYTYNNSTKGTYENIKAFQEHAQEIQERAAVIDTATVLMNMDGRIYMVRNLVDSAFKPYAVLTLELNSSSVFASLESIWGYLDGEVYIDGELLVNGSLDAAAESDKVAGLRQRALQSADEESNCFKNSSGCFVSKLVRMDNNRIVYLVRLDQSELLAEMWSVRFIFILLIVFMIPLFVQVFRFFHKKVTLPLNELVQVSRELEQGNYGCKIDRMAESAEFYYMDEVFNRMSRQLKNQFEKIYLEEIALRDARIMALQSQINPHFLNNTLEIINWEARLNENYKVSGMIEALSTMLEATMNRRAEAMIPLSEELSYMDAYLYIISQRFGEKFQVEKQIDDSLLEVRVPRLMIQPIVENAVEHGMDISKRGQIRIRVYARDVADSEQKQIVVDVEDNGVLTDAEREKIDELLSGTPDTEKERRVSLGIRNVDQRLKIIYGADCGLSIFSNEENHTVSRLTFWMREQ